MASIEMAKLLRGACGTVLFILLLHVPRFGFAKEITVMPDPNYRVLESLKDETRKITLELGHLSFGDVSAYQLRAYRSSDPSRAGVNIGIPIIFIRTSQSERPTLQYDGKCYTLSARFDRALDRITSSYFKLPDSDLGTCFHVVTPEGKKFGYIEPPRSIGGALQMHVFDRDALQEIARRELVGKTTEDAVGTLTRVGFKIKPSSTFPRILRYAWLESNTPHLLDTSIEIAIAIKNDVVEEVEVKTTLATP